MKKVILLLACCALAIGAMAKGSGHSSRSSARSGTSHAIRGHVTKKGAYVAPSRATNPNKTKRDNYSQKGNINPNTGKKGTKN